MIIEVSLMVFSVAVMAFLYVHKYFAQKHGILTAVHSVQAKADPIIEGVKEKANGMLSYVTPHNISIFFHNLFVHTGLFFMHMSRKAHNASARLVEKASRRKENLSKGGAASFYMKQMKDAKDNGAEAETGE